MPFNDQFEKSIRQRFADARMEPSTELWERLEKQLPVPPTKNRIIPFWLPPAIISIAAAIVLFLYIGRPASKVKATHDQVVPQIATTTSPSANEQSTTIPFIEVNEDAVRESGPEPEKTINSVTPRADKPSRNVVQFASRENSEAASNDNTFEVPVNIDLFHKVNLPEVTPVKTSTLDLVATVAKPTLRINTDQIDWSINPLLQKVERHNKPGKKGMLAFFASGRVNKTGLSKEEILVTPNPIVGSNQGYGYTTEFLPVQKNIFPQWASGIEAGAELFFSDHVSMQTGIGISRYRQDFIIGSALADDAAFLETPLGVDPMDPGTINIRPASQVVEANSLEHTSLTIPLGVNVYAGNQKHAVAFNAAVEYQALLTSGSPSLKRAEYDFQTLATTGAVDLREASVDNTLLKNRAITGRVGIRYQHKVGKGMYLFAGPLASYGISPVYSSDSNIDQSKLGLGFEMGVRFQH